MANLKHVWFDLAGTLYRETKKFNEVHDNFRYSTFAKVKGIPDLDKAREEFLDNAIRRVYKAVRIGKRGLRRYKREDLVKIMEHK
jgi:FMN phosphatase YigB (HAD superfamily)